MRILLVHSYFHYLEDLDKPAGGIETHTAGLYRALTALGHDVTIAATRDSRLPLHIKFVPIDNICKDSTKGRYSQIAGYEYIYSKIQDGDFDLVINNNPSFTAFRNLDIICEQENIPHFFFVHHIMDDISTKKNIQILNESSAKVICVSGYIADQIREKGFNKQRVVLNSNFAEPSVAYIGAERGEEVPDGQFIVSMACRIVKARDVLFAIETILNETDFCIKIIGTGVNHPSELDYHNKVLDLAIRNPDRVWIKGRLDQEKTWREIAYSDVYLNLCTHEAYGLSVFEAQKIGIPVVYAYKGRHCGPANIVNVNTGTIDTGAAVDFAGLNQKARAKALVEAIEYTRGLSKKAIWEQVNEFNSPRIFAERLQEVLGL